MMNPNVGLGTKAIHAGNVKDAQYGALTTPIYQTSTFVFDSCEQGGRRFAGQEGGYIYTRLGNPTVSVLENKVAALEGGEACVAAASGMGAISSALWTIAGAGKHIVADGTLYGCTFALLNHGMSRYGVEVSFVDTSDLAAVKAALKENTCAVYLETPANPNLKIADIAAVAEIAHGYNPAIKVVCDNTFASPALQNPLALGADVVVHSATKYLNGHGDVIAGFVVGKADFIGEVRMFGLKDMTGAVMDPFAAYLILRGLKTLEIRMERHCANAKAIAPRRGEGVLSRPEGSRGPRYRRPPDEGLWRHAELRGQGRPRCRYQAGQRAAPDHRGRLSGRRRDADRASRLHDPLHLYRGGAGGLRHPRRSDPSVCRSGERRGYHRRSGAGTGPAVKGNL